MSNAILRQNEIGSLFLLDTIKETVELDEFHFALIYKNKK